jgi:hypothetical protein
MGRGADWRKVARENLRKQGEGEACHYLLCGSAWELEYCKLQIPNSPGKSANMNVVKRLTKLLYGGERKTNKQPPRLPGGERVP